MISIKKNPYPGKFIVFDGLDGSGQSTQAEKLFDFLNLPEKKLKLGQAGAHLTKEPTPNLIGGLIRSQLNHDWKSSPECLQLLFCADRAHHLEKEIIPLLEKGVSVVCDRYMFSTIAFGSFQIEDRDWLIALNSKFLLPDLTFFLRVSPKICIERIQVSRYEVDLFEKLEGLTKVWDNYERLSGEFENIHNLNGERPIDDIFGDIKKIVGEKIINQN